MSEPQHAAPAPTLALGPTRPDKLTLWPVEGDRKGIGVVYVGVHGWRRAC